MLDIRVIKRKLNGFCLSLLRKHKTMNEKTGKPSIKFKWVSSFFLKDGATPEVIALLETDEVMQLKNFLAEIQFAEQFDTSADQLTKGSISLSPAFQHTLERLFIEAKRVGIDFVPSEIMLSALLKKALIVEQKIDKINGFKSNIFTGIQAEENEPNPADKMLFKALINLKQPIKLTCDELEKVAKAIGKNISVPPPQLRDWAGEQGNRNPNKRIKNWCYSIAIDVLLHHDINPVQIIPMESVVNYWLLSYQQQYTLKEAKEKFLTLFNIPKDLAPSVSECITDVYKRF
jgi:hypothetical protein